MSALSLTGLLATKPKKPLSKCVKGKPQIHLRANGYPAPYTLRPFAGLYNPFPYGCSLLCNHPADNDARDVLKRAKDSWATEGKSLLLAEEIAAIRAGLEQIAVNDSAPTPRPAPPVESVPEELFRRYTETDSRPMTPAPTLISGYTRASGSRRCFTPDPIPTAEVRERTLLILDLRRSHSQDTLSWHGSAFQHDTPIIRIHQAPTPSITPESLARCSPEGKKRHLGHARATSSTGKSSKTPEKMFLEVQEVGYGQESAHDQSETEEDVLRRRGKKRKKRGRDSSRGPPAFQSLDPETQVAAIDPDSFDPSARPSLVPPGSAQELGDNKDGERGAAEGSAAKRLQAILDANSYLESDILKRLRRELNDEVIDLEFDQKKRIALEEAKKTMPAELKECEELKQTKEEIFKPDINTELLLTTPRLFVRAGVRFELPMDSRSLNTMTPVEYVRNHCQVSKERKFLYNYIFNRRKMEFLETDPPRKLEGKEITAALGEMMGKPLSANQIENFQSLVSWKDEDVIDFKTFCGLCGLCERYLGTEFCPPLPPKKLDRCHAIETADFESLHRRLIGLKPDERLVKILYHLRDK